MSHIHPVLFSGGLTPQTHTKPQSITALHVHINHLDSPDQESFFSFHRRPLVPLLSWHYDLLCSSD